MLGLGQAHFQGAGNGQNRPLLQAAFKRSGFVDVDHNRFLLSQLKSPRLTGPRPLSGLKPLMRQFDNFSLEGCAQSKLLVNFCEITRA